MTGRDRWNADDPGPVAEYRDAELARRFSADPVPAHQPDFWTDLERGLTGRPDPMVDRAEDEPGVLDLVGPTGTRSSHGRGHIDRGWGAGRWIGGAAATVAVVGLGLAALLTTTLGSSPVRTASPAPGSEIVGSVGGDADLEAGDAAGPIDAARPATTTTMLLSSSTGLPATSAPGPAPAVDYFEVEARVRGLGRGSVVAFSPDDSAVLVVDDAPGVMTGCEGAELLTLYVQDLTTGQRRPAFGSGATVETGGVDLVVSPFGQRPVQVGTRSLYWTDYCDGVRSSTKRGVMAPDGAISIVGDVEAGGAIDPFADADRRVRSSPDGDHELVIGPETAVVVAAGGAGGATHELPTDVTDRLATELSVGTWSPTGDVVALAVGDGVVLWNPFTGQHRRFDSRSIVDLVFDNTGQRLAVVSWHETLVTTVVTFGDLTDPVPAPARCSGRIELDPLDPATLVRGGLGPELAATMVAIDRGAASCDWAALDRLLPDGFVAGFGGGAAVDRWRDQEAGYDSPMWYLRSLLRQPWEVDRTGGGDRVVWPAVHLRDDCTYDDVDRDTLVALGYDPDVAMAECEVIGGYAGYRLAIDEGGVWQWFLAGD